MPMRLCTLRMLEALRILKMADRVRFYQASTSELYGKVQTVPQMKKRHSTHAVLMLLPNFMPIGLRSIIVRHTVCMLQTVFCSIMKVLCAARHSSHAR